MNNIHKSFKAKSQLRHMADGGLVNNGQFNGPQRAADAMARGEDPNADRAKKAAEYGVSHTGKNPLAGTAQERAAAAHPTIDKIATKLRGLVGLADGAHIVRGPGGPTDDKVGPVMLSDGEAVLPADTVEALGQGTVQDMIDATHTPVKSKLRGMANGFDPTLDPVLEMQKRARALHATDMAAGQPPYPNANGLNTAEPARVTVPENTGFRSVEPNARELGLRSQAAAQRAGLPPYPSANGLSATEIPRAEFDAARAPAPAPAAAAPAESAAARTAQAARSGLGRVTAGASSGLSKLRSLPGKLAAPIALGATAYSTIKDTAGTSTDDYRERFPNMPSLPVANALRRFGAGNEGDLVDDLALRTVGAADDLAHTVTSPLNMLGLPSVGLSGLRQPGQAHTSAQLAAQRPGGGTGLSIIDPRDPASMATTPPSANVPNPAAGAPGVAPGSVASGVQNGRPVYDNNSLLRMQARNQQPAVVDRAPIQVQNPLRAPGLNQGSGFGLINSRAGEINKHFDDLAKQIQSLHSGAKFQARGSLATKMLELEKARASALGQDQGARVSSQGNVVSDTGNLRSNASAQFGDELRSQSALRTASASQRVAELQAQTQAAKDRRAQDDADFEQFNNLVSGLAPTDKEGKPLAGFRPDQVKARIFTDNDRFQGPEGEANWASLPLEQKSKYIADTMNLMRATDAVNSTRGLTGTQNTTAAPTSVRLADAGLADIPDLYFNGGLSAPAIAAHTLLPWKSDEVLNTDDGQAVYADDVGGDEVNQQRQVRKSLLRNRGR